MVSKCINNLSSKGSIETVASGLTLKCIYLMIPLLKNEDLRVLQIFSCIYLDILLACSFEIKQIEC